MPDGIYRVQFTDYSGFYASEVYDDVPGDAYSGGTSILVPVTSVVTGINASLVPGSTISGRVTASDGVTPLQNISVSPYRLTGDGGWSGSSSFTTDAAGNYVIRGLAAGSYRVMFRDNNDYYAEETYDNYAGYPWSGGTTIVVPGGGAVSNIDASLAVGGRITGTVFAPDGSTPLPDVDVNVRAWDSGSQSWYTSTDQNGAYEVSGLPAQTYRVSFSDWSHGYITEYYSNTFDSALATPLVVAEGSVITNIDAVMEQYASLAGSVVGDDGVTPVSGVDVQVRETVSGYDTSAYTDTTGAYVVEGLMPGSYQVLARPRMLSGWLAEWYDDVPYIPGQSVPVGLTPVVLTGGAAVAGIDFELSPAARVRGQVTGAGVQVLTDAVVRAEGQTWGQVYSDQANLYGNSRLSG